MFVAKFSVEAPGYLILAAILFSIVGYVVTTNAIANWSSKRLQAWTKARKAKRTKPYEPKYTFPTWNLKEGATVRERIEYTVRYWLETTDPAYITQPSAVMGTPTSAIRDIGICKVHTFPGLVGTWYCELDRFTFVNEDLLDLVRCFDEVVSVEHIYCHEGPLGGILLYFHHSATDEPAH